MYEMPTMRDWQKLADDGRLTEPQAQYMGPGKPVEELYDTFEDPFEINNLVTSKEHIEVLERMRRAHHEWRAEILDLGLLPEPDLRTRFAGEPEFDGARQHGNLFPFQRIAEAADRACKQDPSQLPELIGGLSDEDAAVRYWSAVGLGMLGDLGQSAKTPLIDALDDPAGSVRVAAAGALTRMGQTDAALPALSLALKDANEWVRLMAINDVDRLDADAGELLPGIKAASIDSNQYVVRVATHALEVFSSNGRNR
jgi:hypothetical protein